MISKVRIKNYRSLETLELDLGMSNLLIGQNNTGKSNFLLAINTAIIGTYDLTERDIFVGDDNRLEKSKTAIIDILIRAVDKDKKELKEFTGFWTSVFTETWITTSGEGNFVGIRTEIRFDPIKDSYVARRHCIRQWKDSVDAAVLENKKTVYNEDMRASLQAFYMDANRDIVQDIRNRKSYFGRVTSSYDLTDKKVQEIEEQLSHVNALIINSIPSLALTEERISTIGKTIGSDSSKVAVEPLARKISDISKGMDITMKDGSAATFSISQHGYGTRSWVSFLTLAAFVEEQKRRLKADDEEAEQYIMFTMEEPEAHLHPQAQRQLFEQISRFPGQKIISTHSPSIIAQSTLADIIHFSKRNGKTLATQYKTGENRVDDDLKIYREVLNTRAEFLFASATILCEGITEELALPIFFREYFGCAPFALGVNIINIGGKDNYAPYLSLANDFDIPWFIFSDGEDNAIQSVRTAISKVFNKDYATLDNVVILGDGNDYEKDLIQAGYSELMINAICDHEEENSFFDTYIQRMQGKRRKGGGTRNYNHENGRIEALNDLCFEGKTKYALPVAHKIVTQTNNERRIPPKIKQLFLALAAKIGAQVINAGEGEK